MDWLALIAVQGTLTQPRFKTQHHETTRDACLLQDSWKFEISAWEDFLGRPVVKNLLPTAGDMDLSSGQGSEIPHATEQVRLGVSTTDPG